MLITLEIVAFIATAVLAVLWIREPSGNYEPWTVICGVVATVIELLRRIRGRKPSETTRIKNLRAGESVKKSKVEELTDWILKHGTEKELSKILPRALHLAQLINDHDLEHWTRMELYGYNTEGGMKEEEVVPEYREITGRHMDRYDRMLKVDDPYAFLNTYRFRYGVGKLEEIAKKDGMQNIRDENITELIREHLKVDVFRFCFSPVEIVGVLHSIRNQLLERISQIERAA